jgi:signal transduction histidine kinase
LVARGSPPPNWIELFSTQVKRLSQIVGRLMDFTRATSNDFAMEPVDVRGAIEDIVAMVRHEYLTGGIDITLSLEGGLPPVLGNVTYIQQVFLNLLINAKDAMPHGGKIVITAERKPSRVSIRFTDTGVGIEERVLDKIFTPFFTTKTEGKGTGLGLSICQKIISQFHGEIHVESKVGEGTTFIISLPIA